MTWVIVCTAIGCYAAVAGLMLGLMARMDAPDDMDIRIATAAFWPVLGPAVAMYYLASSKRAYVDDEDDNDDAPEIPEARVIR